MAILLDRGRHARKKDQQNARNFKRNGPLGFSDDGGRNWKFIDGAGVQQLGSRFKSMFPAVPDDLKLPDPQMPIMGTN
jgi:hypothetical protein